MLKVLSKGLWPAIAAKSLKASTRRAAIAYVSERPPISFDQGDVLIVDASDAAIRSGRTSARTLQSFHEAGAELWSHAQLHAKLLLLDDWTIIGSANASENSKTRYTEAALITDRPDIASQAEQFVSGLARRGASIRITPAFLIRISKLPVKRDFVVRAGKAKRSLPTIRSPKTWVISLREDARYPGDADQVDAIALGEQQKVRSGGGEVNWFFHSGRRGFPEKGKPGDIVIWCNRPSAVVPSTRQVRVYPHARLIRVYREDGLNVRTYHCLFPPNAEGRKLNWSAFLKVAKAAGIKRTLSYRSSIQLSEQQSTALFELWPK